MGDTRRVGKQMMRLLKGEDLDSLSRELGVTAATVSEWRVVVASPRHRQLLLEMLHKAGIDKLGPKPVDELIHVRSTLAL